MLPERFRGGLSKSRGRCEGWLSASWRHELAASAVLSAACLVLIVVFTDLKTEGTALYADPGWDRHFYRLMAVQGLFEFRLAPYCWRVLVPALAGWSPLALQTSFFVITSTSLWGTGVVLYFTARGRRHSPTVASLGVLLFYSLGWGSKFIVADFWIPDGAALLLVSLALWAALEKKLQVFGAVMLVAAVTKESVLLAAPLYLCLNLRRPVDGRFVVTAAAALIPAAVVAILLRAVVAQQNGDAEYFATMPEDIRRFPDLFDHYSYGRLLLEVGYEERFRHRELADFLRYTTSPLGIALPILVMFGLRRSWRLALGMVAFFVLTYAQLLFATDTQRLVVLVAPCLVILALEGVREFERQFRLPPAVLIPSAVALFLLVLIGRQTYEVRFEAQALVVAVTISAATLWRRQRRIDKRPRG